MDSDLSLYALVATVDGVSFGPPLGPTIAPAGAFDATQLANLEVVLEASSGGDFVALATFDARSQPALALLAAHELYWVNVPAAAYFTDPARSYRFRALLAGREIGRSDMSDHVFEVLRWVPNLPIGVKLRLEARPAPVLSAVTPTALDTGAAATLTLSGAGFASDSVVRAGGRDLATTFVSSGSLSAALPADLAVAGTLAISVFTPAPGGGTSGELAVGLRAPIGISCESILRSGAGVGDGVYMVNPDGSGAFPVYCDMTRGGWALAATMAHISQGLPGCNDATMLSPAATPGLPLPGQYCRKLSDAQINALKGASSHLNAYQVSCGGGTRYFRTACTFAANQPSGTGPCNGAAGGQDATDYFSYDHGNYYALVAGYFGSYPLKMFYWANNHNSCLGPDDATYFNGTNRGTLYIR